MGKVIGRKVSFAMLKNFFKVVRLNVPTVINQHLLSFTRLHYSQRLKLMLRYLKSCHVDMPQSNLLAIRTSHRSIIEIVGTVDALLPSEYFNKYFLSG